MCYCLPSYLPFKIEMGLNKLLSHDTFLGWLTKGHFRDLLVKALTLATIISQVYS